MEGAEGSLPPPPPPPAHSLRESREELLAPEQTPIVLLMEDFNTPHPAPQECMRHVGNEGGDPPTSESKLRVSLGGQGDLKFLFRPPEAGQPGMAEVLVPTSKTSLRC